jgi:tetracycline repressor-like protein
MFRDLLADGTAAGAFRISDVPLTTIAVLTMCSGVSDWFADRGRLSAKAVVDGYTDMALRLLQPGGGRPAAKDAPARAKARRR